MIPGGWQVHTEISAKNMAIFEGIKPSLKNGEYTPLAVGTMSVGSTTVCFICRAELANLKEYFAKVIVQIPIGGEPSFVSAKEIFI